AQNNAQLFIPAAVARNLVLSSTVGNLGDRVSLSVSLAAQGGENALGFSISFDAALLTVLSIRLGSSLAGLANPVLFTNTSLLSKGKIGVTIAQQPAESFSTGSKEVLALEFRIMQDFGGASQLTFTDQPVVRELVDSEARTLPAVFQ